MPGAKEQLWFYSEVLAVIKNGLKNDIVQNLEEVYREAQKVFNTFC